MTIGGKGYFCKRLIDDLINSPSPPLLSIIHKSEGTVRYGEYGDISSTLEGGGLEGGVKMSFYESIMIYLTPFQVSFMMDLVL